MQTTSHKNIELEEELCATQQEITRKAAEITDLLRNCSEASQKISNSKHANATLKTTLESVMKEKGLSIYFCFISIRHLIECNNLSSECVVF